MYFAFIIDNFSYNLLCSHLYNTIVSLMSQNGLLQPHKCGFCFVKGSVQSRNFIDIISRLSLPELFRSFSGAFAGAF